MAPDSALTRWIPDRLKPSRRLDPRQTARIREEYDGARGYRAYHQICRMRSALELSPGRDAVGDHGFEHLRVMGSVEASTLLEELHRDCAVGPAKRDSADLRGFQIDDCELRDRILRAALTTGAHERIERSFESHYRVHWYFVTCTLPGESTYSSQWHCDKGPSRHLKLLVHLNDEAEHGGGTELLGLEASDALTRLGYGFGPARGRSADLSSLAPKAGVRARPVRCAMAAGDGILLQPARVLHRGRPAQHGPRYLLTLCLLPSPVPWQESLERGGLFDLRRDPKWHRDARTLL